MPNNKPTDIELIKALNLCKNVNVNRQCDKCFYRNEMGMCVECLLEDTLNLINRNNAENERLNKEIERLKEENELLKIEQEYEDGLAECIKIQAVKEFMDKSNKMITEIYNKHIFGHYDWDDSEKDAIINFSDDITYGLDKLLKERVGEVVAENP